VEGEREGGYGELGNRLALIAVSEKDPNTRILCFFPSDAKLIGWKFWKRWI
jgi:hypothetical protein